MSRPKLVLVAAVALAVCACATRRATIVPPRAEPTLTIYIVSHGWHTGIVVRRADIPAGLWPEAEDFPAADHIEVGWGDRDYYPAPDPGLRLLLKAAFGASPSVLHAAGFRGPPEAEFPESEIVALTLSRRDLERLARYVHDAYDRGGERRAPRLGPGLYGDSHFYPAVGTFHLFRDCNVWTARALRAAGLPVNDAITKRGLMSQVRRLGVVVAPGARTAAPRARGVAISSGERRAVALAARSAAVLD